MIDLAPDRLFSEIMINIKTPNHPKIYYHHYKINVAKRRKKVIDLVNKVFLCKFPFVLFIFSMFLLPLSLLVFFSLLYYPSLSPDLSIHYFSFYSLLSVNYIRSLFLTVIRISC